MIQRDSLLKSNEKLLRENEYVKLNLKQAYTMMNTLKDEQEIRIRSLAESGEDTVGRVLDELDDWMEDVMDARQTQLTSIGKVTDLAYEWTNKHAASVSARATAEMSHRESMETIKRVQAKEIELQHQRDDEIKMQREKEEGIMQERQKAYAVLAKEIASIEVLTDEEILTKIQTINDIDTLRGMIHKLLYTKIKRHNHETPEQRIIRIRKENTPILLKSILQAGSKRTERLLNMKYVARMILEIYCGRIVEDDTEIKEHRIIGSSHHQHESSSSSFITHSKRIPLASFTYTYFLRHFGLRHMAENNMTELLRTIMISLNQHKTFYANKYNNFYSINTEGLSDPSCTQRCTLFTRFLHLYTDHPLPSESLEFMMYLLKLLQQACVQSLPPNFNMTSSSSQTTTNLDSKSMVRMMEYASVNMMTSNALVNQEKKRRETQSRNALTRTTMNQHHGAEKSLGDEPTSISMHLPLFLSSESLAHALKQLGYTDEHMDMILCKIETQCVYPCYSSSANSTLNSTDRVIHGSGGITIDLPRMRILLKQIIVRQMIRTAGVGSMTAFEKFDQDRSGVIDFNKLRVFIDMDKDTAHTLSSLMDHVSGILGPTGGITSSDFIQSLHPDYRLCVNLDTLLETSTELWLEEHISRTNYYHKLCQSYDEQHNLLSYHEFTRLIHTLESHRTSKQCMKLFRDGKEYERSMRIRANEEVEAQMKERSRMMNKKKSNKKKKRDMIPPPPPFTGIGANPIEGKTIGEVESESETNSMDSTTTTSIVVTAPEESSAVSASPATLSTPTPPTITSTNSMTPHRSTKSADKNKSSSIVSTLVNSNLIKDTDFLSLDTILLLLRRHRIGLPPRKSYHEFKSFFRRYRMAVTPRIITTTTTMMNVNATMEEDEDESTTTSTSTMRRTIPESILESELAAGITSIPE